VEEDKEGLRAAYTGSVRATESEAGSTRSLGSFRERFHRGTGGAPKGDAVILPSLQQEEAPGSRALRRRAAAAAAGVAGAAPPSPEGGIGASRRGSSAGGAFEGGATAGCSAAGGAAGHGSSSAGGRAGGGGRHVDDEGPTAHSRFWSRYSRHQSDKARIKREFDALVRAKAEMDAAAEARQAARWQREQELAQLLRKKRSQREAQMDLFGDLQGSGGGGGAAGGRGASGGVDSLFAAPPAAGSGGGRAGRGALRASAAPGSVAATFFAGSGLDIGMRPLTPGGGHTAMAPSGAGADRGGGGQQQLVLGFDLSQAGDGDAPIEPTLVQMPGEPTAGGSTAGSASATSSRTLPGVGASSAAGGGGGGAAQKRAPGPAIPWELLEELEVERTRFGGPSATVAGARAGVPLGGFQM
jgi:hypothetical protein